MEERESGEGGDGGLKTGDRGGRRLLRGDCVWVGRGGMEREVGRRGRGALEEKRKSRSTMSMAGSRDGEEKDDFEKYGCHNVFCAFSRSFALALFFSRRLLGADPLLMLLCEGWREREREKKMKLGR